MRDTTLARLGNAFGARSFVSQRQQRRNTKTRHHYAFTAITKAVDRYFSALFESKPKEYAEQQSKALIGEPNAVAYFQEQIANFLRDNPQFHTDYPDYYDSLPEAIFHELLGFGPMAVWFKNPTESAAINGTQILFEQNGRKVLQPFSYSSIDQVRRMIRNLESRQATTKHNEFHPTVAIEMLNGTRVQVFDKPLVKDPYVVFRQYTFRDYTFVSQAQYRTIAEDSVRFYNLLGRLPLNGVAVGAVKAGKSSWLKTIVGTKDPDLLLLTLETDSAEIRIAEAFPERRAFVVELVATINQQRALMPDLLRSDAAYFLVPEIRSGELELFLEARSKGKYSLTTYHGHASPEDIPTEFANQSVRDFPNRNWTAEYTRAAKAIDLVMSLYEVEEGPDRGRKILDKVLAFDYDDATATLHMIPWVTYRRQTDDWVYNPDLPSSMIDRLRRYDPELLRTFKDEFEAMAKTHPHQGPVRKSIKTGGPR